MMFVSPMKGNIYTLAHDHLIFLFVNCFSSADWQRSFIIIHSLVPMRRKSPTHEFSHRKAQIISIEYKDVQHLIHGALNIYVKVNVFQLLQLELLKTSLVGI